METHPRRLLKDNQHRFRNQSTMFMAAFVGLLLIIMLMPIGTEPRGQLLQLTGIVISAAIALSSGTFIANAMAGIMLKSVRNFRTGDWLEVEGVWGRVSERGLFHTGVQTPDRDLTTLLLATLHAGGVEIVSPLFNNPRAVSPDSRFIPRPERQSSQPAVAEAAKADRLTT